MTGVLIIFMLIIAILAIVLFLTVRLSGKKTMDDPEFLNSDGDHIYYDRSSIEKKEFMRRHSDVKNLRSFSRLFGKKD